MTDSIGKFITVYHGTTEAEALKILSQNPDIQAVVFDDKEPTTQDYDAPKPLKFVPVMVDNRYWERGESARARRRREARQERKRNKKN